MSLKPDVQFACISIQSILDESGEIHGDLEAMSERIDYLAGVYCTEGMSQQVLELGRRTEELQQVIKVQLPNLQDAAKVKESSFSNASWCLGWCIHHPTEIISSEDNLYRA